MAMASIVSTEGNVLLESEGDLNNAGAQITAFYESHSQLLGNNINLNSETGEMNAAGALIASAETTELTTKDGDINLDAQTNDHYSESSGWSIGVSFGGSNIVDAALKGGSVSDLVDAYAQTNALAGALSTLANADGKQTRQALINASLGVKKGGQSLLTAFNADNPAALTDSLNNTLNPFKSLTEPALGGLTVSMGRHKSRNDWQDSQQTRIYGGKNIIIEAGGKGKLNQLGGTILSTNIESLSEELSHSAGNNTAHALAALWEQGDQYTDPDEQSINLSGAQGINIIGLTETASSESSNTGVDVTFTGAGLAGISGVSLNHNESQSNSTRVTQGHIDSDGGQITFNTGAGSDLLIQGAVIDVGATHYNVGSDVIVESLQDSEETNNQGFGVSVSLDGGPNSLSVNQGRTDRSEVTEQSGIYSTGGVSGRIGGNVVLNGGVMINEGGPNTVELGGSVITTDLSNRARIESQGLSIGLGGGQTADNGEGKGKGSSNPLSNLSLPSHRDERTDSTTYAVLDGITFTRPDGRTVDTQDIRSEIDGANERLEIPGEEDNNSLAIFAGTLLSVEITNQIGNLGMFQNGQNENQGWQEGGFYKAAAHLANGALTNLLTGGDSRDSLSAGLSAAAVEMAMPYLSTGNDQTDQQLAGLLGGVVSHATGGDFDSGAISGSVAEAFNRQMHQKEIDWVKKKAPAFAVQEGLTIKEATAILAQQALRIIDTKWDYALGEDAQHGAAAFIAKEGEGLFTATQAERDNFYLNADIVMNPDADQPNSGWLRERGYPQVTSNQDFYRDFVSTGVVNTTEASMASVMQGGKDFFVNTKDGLVSLYEAVSSGAIGLSDAIEMMGDAVTDISLTEPLDNALLAAMVGDAAEVTRILAEATTGLAAGVGKAVDGVIGSVTRVKVPCCFIAGTPIKTPDGYTPIDALTVGDTVLSRDIATGAIVQNKVTNTHIRPISEIKTFYKLTIESAHQHEALYVTGEHPFWVTDKQQWITVDDLSIGAALSNHQGTALRVRSKVLLTQLQQTYNITVAGNHNYFAGRLDTLVHNCDETALLSKYPDATVSADGQTITTADGKKFYDVGDGNFKAPTGLNGDDTAYPVEAFKSLGLVFSDEQLSKLSATGMTVKVEGSGRVSFKDGTHVIAEFSDGTLAFKYDGFGGNIVMDSDKTTTVLGKFADNFPDPQSPGTRVFLGSDDAGVTGLPSGSFSRGEGQSPNNGGMNFLDIDEARYNEIIDRNMAQVKNDPANAGLSDETLSTRGLEKGNDEFWNTYNEPFLEDSFKRGDNIRLVSDPDSKATRSGTYKRELESIQGKDGSVGLAEKYGYVYDEATFTYKKRPENNSPVANPPKTPKPIVTPVTEKNTNQGGRPSGLADSNPKGQSPTLPEGMRPPEFGLLAGWARKAPDSWDKVARGYTDAEITAIKDAGVTKQDIISWKNRYENLNAVRISKGNKVDTPEARAKLMDKILEKW